mmetsp:Transcript_16059/g.40360  ORF Transcript_16059/g.40360 Transcript_16059/m.40360 type:complete len:86 (-) Transcript_16059:160-417(-)
MRAAIYECNARKLRIPLHGGGMNFGMNTKQQHHECALRVHCPVERIPLHATGMHFGGGLKIRTPVVRCFFFRRKTGMLVPPTQRK